jgi:uncharacterized phage-associated protein
MAKINDVCDYIILMTTEGKDQLTILKLQKLLYYVQAWHLAIFDKPLFDGKFQAWVHGPVSTEIFNRFIGKKTLFSIMFSVIDNTYVSKSFNLEDLFLEEKRHINNVLEVYAKYSGTQLGDISCNEDPWIFTREGYKSPQRCEKEIDETVMKEYYQKKLKLLDPLKSIQEGSR